MKKVIAILLVLVMALSLCACGGANNSKYVGTYSGYYGLSQVVVDDTGYAHGNQSIDGTRTLTLNSDGTGKEVFVGKVPYVGDNITVYDCQITWEVIDDYLYVTGSGDNLVGREGEQHTVNDRYKLEGKTLVDADNPDSISGKLTKQ